MQRKTILLIFTLVIMVCSRSEAQYQSYCIDSFLVRPGMPCPVNFMPVCGCNNITYLNSCKADAAGVINYLDAPCEPLAFRMTPNPSQEDIRIQAKAPQTCDMRFTITDIYGKIYFDRTYSSTKEVDVWINLYGLYNGIYILLGRTGDYYNYQKFQFVSR